MGDHEGGREVGAEDVLEGVDRLLADERARHHARGMDQQVDRAGLGHHPGEGVRVGAVGGHPAGAELVGGGAEGGLGAGREDQVVVPGGQDLGHAEADAAAAPGD